jgi:hypothetical protein
MSCVRLCEAWSELATLNELVLCRRDLYYVVFCVVM